MYVHIKTLKYCTPSPTVMQSCARSGASKSAHRKPTATKGAGIDSCTDILGVMRSESTFMLNLHKFNTLYNTASAVWVYMFIRIRLKPRGIR